MARRSDPQTTVPEAERVLTEIALREPQRDFDRRPLKLSCVRFDLWEAWCGIRFILDFSWELFDSNYRTTRYPLPATRYPLPSQFPECPLLAIDLI